MEFVLVTPGEFMMGNRLDEDDVVRRYSPGRGKCRDIALRHLKHEYPRHRVRITKPFYIAKYELTRP